MNAAQIIRSIRRPPFRHSWGTERELLSVHLMVTRTVQDLARQRRELCRPIGRWIQVESRFFWNAYVKFLTTKGRWANQKRMRAYFVSEGRCSSSPRVLHDIKFEEAYYECPPGAMGICFSFFQGWWIYKDEGNIRQHHTKNKENA